MSALPGLPKPLECLLRGLLEENHLSSWTSDWADGDVKVTIRFSAAKKNGTWEENTLPEAAGGKIGLSTKGQDSDSDSDDDTTLGGGKGAVITEQGTAGKPRRYHLLELASSPPEKQQNPSFPGSPCTAIMTEEETSGGLGRRGMTTSTSSSSEDNVPDKDCPGQNTRSYRPINIRDFGNTYSSSSAENSSPEGYDEVDCTPPLKVYNQTNASDTADKFDATRLVDITE